MGRKEGSTHTEILYIYIKFCFQHEFCHKNVAVQLLCVYIKYLANFGNYRFYCAW